MRSNALTQILLSLFVLVAFTVSAAGDDGVAPEDAKFTPGKEVKVLDPESGAAGYYVVYTPKDYKPENPMPLILCYHGKTGSPTSWPFKDLTDGHGYIIIGFDYQEKDQPN